MKYANTLEGKVISRVNRRRATVFLREDFLDLSDYDQVGRALRNLSKQGKLIKIGYGLYAKARISALTGKPTLAEPLPALAKTALERIGVPIGVTQAELEYIEGRSTQVPTGRMIAVEGRVTRKIMYRDVKISYERKNTR
ncbi:MAG TPA: DUF6088 family protein [Sediminibacterium sp.]|jgi:hypothetical protein